MFSTAQQALYRQQYQRQGYLVLPGFKSLAEVAALRARAEAIVAALHMSAQRSVFSTDDQARGSSDAEFLASAESVHCFFEPEAFDVQGQLRQTPSASINKIGHALHDLDPVFDAFSHGVDLAVVADIVGLQAPQLWQSMHIFKPPDIGGEVRWHQDASFLATAPDSVTGFWFALDDAHRDNGCLWVQPGGHLGPLRERFVRDGQATRMLALDATPWPRAGEADTLPVEVPAGSLVVLHGLLPHWSAPNRSNRWRQAYTLHATDGRATYARDNWLQRPTLALRGFVG